MSSIRDAEVEMNNTNKVGNNSNDAQLELQTYDPNMDLRGIDRTPPNLLLAQFE